MDFSIEVVTKETQHPRLPTLGVNLIGLEVVRALFREHYPNADFFLVRILPYSDWIRENMDQKKIRIWTLFTQCTLTHYCPVFPRFRKPQVLRGYKKRTLGSNVSKVLQNERLTEFSGNKSAFSSYNSNFQIIEGIRGSIYSVFLVSEKNLKHLSAKCRKFLLCHKTDPSFFKHLKDNVQMANLKFRLLQSSFLYYTYETKSSEWIILDLPLSQ